jgi:hypothetical protein
MKLVIIESPYAGDVERNTKYARRCMLDSIRRGEAPFASHLLYTQVLDDADPAEREQGIQCGFAWGEWADKFAFYIDYGMTDGMQAGLQAAYGRADLMGFKISIRNIGRNEDAGD